MKLRQLAPQTIHTTGFDKGERTKFKMATSAKTYKIMSSTIYKYKIRAIIREISSNAIDGHMVAGNMNPFDVQLPTVLDPRFIVRDYGTGLSDWMVKEVFATYFESTKTDTDELIGALGLGSKSPFCYTETFTIESIQDGVKRAYTAYMDNGEPFVDQIYETETDEPNGVQITVPVKVEDIAEWEREAARVYEPFTGIRPRFIGVQVDVNWQPKEADDRGIIRYKSINYSGVYARMGNICYPIDMDMFENSLFYCYRNSNYAYILDFPLGSLDFMPSREELSLDKVTKKVILDRLEKINKRYDEELVAEFGKQKTTRDKIIWFNNLPSMLQAFVSRDKRFRVGKDSLAEILTHLKSSETATGKYIWGFWANPYDGKDCVFERVGSGRRYETYKAETTKRQDVMRMIQPWRQKKLFIVENDNEARSLRPYLIGYCMLNGSDRISFVTKEINSEPVQDLIRTGYFDESEIVTLKTSEMTKEFETYTEDRKRWKATRESSSGDSEPRPKTPTAYHYFLDGRGNLQKNDLYLTKAQFVKLDEMYAMRLYGVDEYSRLDGESQNYSLGSIASSMMTMLTVTGLNEVMVLRNSLWSRIPDSNMKCLDDYLVKRFADAAKKMKPNWFPSWISSNHGSEIRTLRDSMGVTLDRMVKNRYNPELYMLLDYLDGKFTYDVIEGKNKSKTVVRNPLLREMSTKYYKMRKDMKERVDTAYDLFAKRNPSIHYMLLHSSYSTFRSMFNDDKIVMDLVNLIRWK
ncbi:putative rII A protein [Enterobacter phage HK6]